MLCAHCIVRWSDQLCPPPCERNGNRSGRDGMHVESVNAVIVVMRGGGLVREGVVAGKKEIDKELFSFIEIAKGKKDIGSEIKQSKRGTQRCK